jgi:acyl transferase domain-containing protein/thioester reductase-like protein/acyl carrier protein/SAM-dependent methyltransferase
VTAPKATLSKLTDKFRSDGIRAVEIALFGRFHAERHRALLGLLSKFCDANPEFDFPEASHLRLQCRADIDPTGCAITTGKLSPVALEAILVRKSEWGKAFMSVRVGAQQDTNIFIIGPEKCAPPSFMQTLHTDCRLIHLADATSQTDDATPWSLSGNENDIAVIGMACRVAGADDVDEFWDILCEGQSQHTEVPASRFSFETAFRDFDKRRKWYGNFIKGQDSFDHKFFKKTPREAASMDPQQRLLLEVAYQAVSQSGYFQNDVSPSDVGCYIGTCAVDYEYNVACHAPNAFSSTGNLRGFIAGKVSHYFGWTGPGLTIDTACSSAAVAVHQACKAILSGECGYALAGGVNLITQPLSYQNLAAASFLSQTGQCKPFCASADGYCRGEGIGAVFLKKKSDAMAEGDQIFGVISGTAVQQNQNCTPIFVPNAPSLSELSRNVLDQAQTGAEQVSYVEAHGTGTPVGDPAEYESISEVFAKVQRSSPVQLGSVKALVGHTESSSGLVSLVKVLLMMHHSTIPPQPSFQGLNPQIKSHELVEIPTFLRAWDNPHKVALINNYGASGSNASMLVKSFSANKASVGLAREGLRYPFLLSALDEKSLRAYANRIGKLLNSRGCDKKHDFIRDLSFNICRQSNPRLPKAIILSSSSISELQKSLEAPVFIERPSPPPVVFCFGGQISTFVGLDRDIFERTTILRSYLDSCDQASNSSGFGSIYPDIFKSTPVRDIVSLQLCLFSLQYASAMSWISCGIQPAALVGHSFGELTALCVSKALSLHDAVTMVAGRAKIVRDQWGPDTGAMMAVEADSEQVEALISMSRSSGYPIAIACFNGPRSFTLAGTSESIDAAAELIRSGPPHSSIHGKKLNVTNAFHSTLVDDLKPKLDQLASNLVFGEPVIPIEFCTKDEYMQKLGPNFIAYHMRDPVYFHQAVKRLSGRLHSCVWLEIGSNSTVTQMANRVLNESKLSSHVFVPVNITNGGSTTNLTSTTLDLWKASLGVTFWQHHSSQTDQYSALILPPYQFEKSSHWMELKVPLKTQSSVAEPVERKGLWAFEGYLDSEHRSVRFRILSGSDEYRAIVCSHIIAQTAPICPATLEVDIAIDALMNLYPGLDNDSLQPEILNVDNHAPICLDSSRVVWLNLRADDISISACREWSWEVTSQSHLNNTKSTVHVTGKIMFCPVDDANFQKEFARYERLVSHQRCVKLLYGNDPGDDIVQGASIYRIFNEVVEYGERFQGLKRLVGRESTKESAGQVVKRYAGTTWLDADLSDCFSQVGGIWVNCMSGKGAEEMYIANGFEKWARSPKLLRNSSRPESWDVFSSHNRQGSDAFLTDIFIFDPRNGALVECILGVNFAKVSKLSMGKLLARLTVDIKTVTLADPAQSRAVSSPGIAESGTAQEGETFGIPTDVTSKIRLILADLSGLDVCEIKNDSHLADIGIDSLMGMELARGLEEAFDCTLSMDVLMEVLNFEGLVQCIHQTLRLVFSDSSDVNGSSTIAADTPQTSVGEIPCDTPTWEVPLIEGISQISANKPNGPLSNAIAERGLFLPSSAVLDAFAESKALTDYFIEEHGCEDYLSTVMPMKTELCIALTLEAFATLECDMRLAMVGQELKRIDHIPSLAGLVDYLYDMLEQECHIIRREGTRILRTSVAAPTTSSVDALQALMHSAPQHHYPHMLTYFAGSRLAEVLSGNSDGIKVLFGTDEGKKLSSGLYADSPLNRLSYAQIKEFIKRLVSKLPKSSGPLKILELGAGTGGTTKGIVPLLADLDIPVKYIFSDLSPSFVAAARKRFGKNHPFMSFRTIDVEKGPPEDLISSQHMVLASNAVHATHSLTSSLENIRKTLRPDGFIIILEMTRTLYWVDMIFGLLEGWWLFDDGRRHAIAHQSRWQNDLYSVGYGHVDWTDGNHPETTIQRVFLALKDKGDAALCPPRDIEARQGIIDAYVKKYTQDFSISTSLLEFPIKSKRKALCILVTGATGSLGSHIVAHLSHLPHVRTVICLNRTGTMSPRERQAEALKSRGIETANLSKLEIVETDSTKPMLGLEKNQYDRIVSKVTHIVHNAWPMSGKRPLRGFEAQFKFMRNLLSIAGAAASVQKAKITFQFISSIAVVGHYPTITGEAVVPEERVETAAAVLPNGYGDAKWACERMLDETLHKYPQTFRAMAVRLGQIAGSRTSGYWNHMEHFTFVVQSSQTLRAFPTFDGLMSWTPVNDVAGSLGDLLLHDTSATYPIYHIDNPVRQQWSEIVPVLADSIGADLIPFPQWLKRVRSFSFSFASQNPAAKLIDFFDQDYMRMSCGGLLLDTARACEHSEVLRAVGAISPEVVLKYIESWKLAGVLRA